VEYGIAAVLVYGLLVLFMPIVLLGMYHRLGTVIEIQRRISGHLSALIQMQQEIRGGTSNVRHLPEPGVRSGNDTAPALHRENNLTNLCLYEIIRPGSDSELARAVGSAEGRRQKAEGGMQKAEGGRQKAEGGRQKAEGRRRKAEGGRRSAECGVPVGQTNRDQIGFFSPVYNLYLQVTGRQGRMFLRISGLQEKRPRGH